MGQNATKGGGVAAAVAAAKGSQQHPGAGHPASAASPHKGHHANTNTQATDSDSDSDDGAPVVTTSKQWTPLRRNGIALYDFEPQGSFQVSLHKDVKVEVFEEAIGWYRGAVLTVPPKNGIFPASFIKLLDEIPDDSNKAQSDVLKRLQAIRERKKQLQAQRLSMMTPSSTTKKSRPTKSTQPQPPLPGVKEPSASASASTSLPPIPAEDEQSAPPPLPDVPAADDSNGVPPLPSLPDVPKEDTSPGLPPPPASSSSSSSASSSSSSSSASKLVVPTSRQRRKSINALVDNRVSYLGQHTATSSELDLMELTDINETFTILELDEFGKARGFVVVDELKELLPDLNDRVTLEDLQRLIAVARPDEQGRITRDKFVTAMKQLGLLRLADNTTVPGPAATDSKQPDDQDDAAAEDDAQRAQSLAELSKLLSDEEKEMATDDALDILVVMDPEHKGVVDTFELLEVIDDLTSETLSDHQMERLFLEADPDNAGVITRLNFLKMLKMCLEEPPDGLPVGYEHVPLFYRRKTQSQVSNQDSNGSTS